MRTEYVYLLIAIIAALVINWLANLVFVPRYGYPAAAVISLSTVSIYILVTSAILFRFRKRGFFKE